MSLDEALDDAERNKELTELQNALNNAQRQLAAAKIRNDQLVAATLRGAYEATIALGKPQPIPAPQKDTRKINGEVALIHSTDWQGAKVTTTYNSEIMRRRVMQFAEKVVGHVLA